MAGGKSAKVLIIILVILIAIGIIAGVFVYKILKNPQSAFEKPLKSATGELVLDESQQDPNAATEEDIVNYNGLDYKYNENTINVLLLGIDSDAWRESEHMGWRSDMMMLCTIDFERNSVVLTSIPRDTRTDVCHVDTSTGEITSMNLDKINAAYSYGGGPNKFGPQNATRAAMDFLSVDRKYHVPIDYYISIDLEGVPKFATTLDGVEVTLDVNFPNLGAKGESITLDENTARMYLENRKEVGGELVRVSHEQQFLKAVMKKIKSMGAVSAASKLYSEMMEYMHTNMSLDQILALAKVLDNCSIDGVVFQTINGDFDYMDGVSYFIPDISDVEQKTVELLYIPA